MPRVAAQIRAPRWALLLAPAIGLLFGACARSQVQDLEVVDCLLPGQNRIVGGRPYITPRRPTQTTSEDCVRRGGEHLVTDPSDYRNALARWLEAAQGNDEEAKEAQYHVGVIYEKGLAGERDPAAAAMWYRRAAEAGYTRAQYNLGTLYELGLGVEQNPLEALNWYRRASGLQDRLIYGGFEAEEVARMRAELEAVIAQQNEQIDALKRRLEELKQAAADNATAKAERDALSTYVAQLEEQRNASVEKVAGLPTTSTSPPPESPSNGKGYLEPEQRSYRQRDFGRYFALIIGVESYPVLSDTVPSARSDVDRIGTILTERYGFSVNTLHNPTQRDVAQEINGYSTRLTDRDNLLIYFAGIGERLQSGRREDGYWLPTDAEAPPNDTLWVSNEFVTRHLGRLPAKRILVVSDASYTGLLSSEPGQLIVRDASYSDNYIAWKLPMRGRLLLSSGTDRPLATDTTGAHSVFAQAFIAELETSEQLLTAPELHLRIRDRIQSAGATPELKSIKEAGHEVGDFFFVPNT